MATPPDESAPARDEATQVGRGAVYIAAAKLYFIAGGFLLEVVGLPQLLSRAVFGAYAFVNSMVSPLNGVMITGTIQAVSRFTAHDPARARAVQRAGLRMHLLIGLPIALAFAGLSPVIAWLAHDMSKTGPLMLASLIVAGYAFYAVFVGTANGTRAFHKQAALDGSFTTLRVGGMLGLAAAGFGLYGVIGGWVGAVAAIVILSMILVGLPGRRPAGEEPVSMRPLVGFLASVAVYLILFNLIMSIDTLLLKRLTTEWFRDHGALDGKAAALAADGQVGYYRAVQNLARLPYQVILAATFVVFPLVSRSTFDNDRGATERYIRTTMRYSLIFAAALAVVFAANPLPLLDLPYPADYAHFGAPALTALALGHISFSLFAVAGTILNGSGRTRDAIAVAAATLVLAAIANAIVIPRVEPGRDVLLACAAATSGAMTLGAALAGWLLRRHLGAFLPVASVVRVALAIAAAMGVARLLAVSSPLLTLVEAGVVVTVFAATLIVTRELGPDDLRAVARVVRRRKGS